VPVENGPTLYVKFQANVVNRIHGHVVPMAPKAGTLPKTMPSPETGETLTRGVRPLKVTYKGKPSLWICRGTTRRVMATARMLETQECCRSRAARAEGEGGWHPRAGDDPEGADQAPFVPTASWYRKGRTAFYVMSLGNAAANASTARRTLSGK
jgi:hypothetical protein